MAAPAAISIDHPSPEPEDVNAKDRRANVTEEDIELASSISGDSLPPVDTGRQAWLVAGGAFALGITVWGFPYSFGVFQEFYLRQPEFANDVSGVASVGTTMSGIMYLSSPVVFILLQRYRSFRVKTILVGFAIMLSGLVGASFANDVAQLVATQGVLYGIGGSLLYFPIYLYIDEWFVKRRGLAYGALIAGDGAGGVAIPLLMEWMLNRWGFRTAMRIWVVVCFLLTSGALLCLKERKTVSEKLQRGFDLRFLKSPAFWILMFGNTVQSLGSYMPLLYMPTFAAARGWPSMTGTIAVCLSNAAMVFGALSIGWLCDRVHVTTGINLCALGMVAAIFLIWSFSVYQPVLYIFAFAYGIFSGGFPATWAGCSDPVRRDYPVDNGMVVALFTAGKGISNIVAGPLSGALVNSDPWKGTADFAYGSGYGLLFVFSGITACFAFVGWIGKKTGLVT